MSSTSPGTGSSSIKLSISGSFSVTNISASATGSGPGSSPGSFYSGSSTSSLYSSSPSSSALGDGSSIGPTTNSGYPASPSSAPGLASLRPPSSSAGEVTNGRYSTSTEPASASTSVLYSSSESVGSLSTPLSSSLIPGASNTAPESSAPAVTSARPLIPASYGYGDAEQTMIPSNGTSSHPTKEPSSSVAGPSDLPTASGPSGVSSTSPVTGSGGSSASSSGSPYTSGVLSGASLPSSSEYPMSSLALSRPSETTEGTSSSPASTGRSSTSSGMLPTDVVPSSTFSTSTISSNAGGYGGYSYPASFPYGDRSSSAPESLPTDSSCDKWVGVEVIIMVDEVEICPDGQTITTTSTVTYDIMTRSICATSRSSSPCYICAFGLPTAADLITVTITSNTARPEPVPTLSMQMCATCERTVVKMAVEGHTPGTECSDCAPSTPDGPSSATLTLSDVQTISLGSYSLGSSAIASTPTKIATSKGKDPGSGTETEPVITPTPFATAPEPSSTTLYDPPTASTTYVTAGSVRIVARGAVLGFVVLVMMAMLAH
ncbi:hypothetical protein N0V93_008570 [Gnomoniopsis smithogilvyi]|uniref:Uncharacterized protein n=1 Tax=Gnomoniopsis smithogilvyi TaxID=1191159 RepID=A0A9W8YM89_9PEZI|nr:hypothetical protein N0V93_008570 [Gnomoniopsis smithogilvyi]